MSFNHPEKKALISIIITTVIFSAAVLYIGKKNYWFSTVVKYKTLISDADGLRAGAKVSLKGIMVGEVTKLKVNEDEKIEVNFIIYSSMSSKIRKGTQALIVRSFLIGEKRIDLHLGPKTNDVIPHGGVLEGVDSREITDIISGKNLSPIITKMEKVGANLDKLLNAVTELSDSIRPKDMTKTWDVIHPTLVDISKAAKSLSASLKIAKIMKRDFLDNKLAKKTLEDTRTFLSPFKNRTKSVEELIDSAHKLAGELGDNPNLTKDVTKALQEAIITLKAIQKTWLLKGHVKEVKKKD